MEEKPFRVTCLACHRFFAYGVEDIQPDEQTVLCFNCGEECEHKESNRVDYEVKNEENN